jgi:polar amino acid transport system substrate-binding protein
MSAHTRRRVAVRAATGAILLVLGACALPQSPVEPSGTPPLVVPADAGTAPGVTSSPQRPCKDPTPSTRPPAHMPTPGQMPAGSTMAAIKNRGYLVAGVAQDTFGWGYLDPASKAIQGFDIDMVKAVARAIFNADDPGHLHLVVVPNAERADALTRTKLRVDIVAETMTITCERRQTVDFSAEYFAAGQEVLVPTGSGITSDALLGGRRVCAASGSTSLTNLATKISVEPPVLRIQARNQTDCLAMLQQGEVDAISTDNTILQGMVRQDPTLRLVGPVFSDEPYGMAIALHHADFTAFVNGVLAGLTSGTGWKTSYQTWLSPGTPLARIPAPPTPRYTSGSS